jgi:hypothetical protein
MVSSMAAISWLDAQDAAGQAQGMSLAILVHSNTELHTVIQEHFCHVATAT